MEAELDSSLLMGKEDENAGCLLAMARSDEDAVGENGFALPVMKKMEEEILLFGREDEEQVAADAGSE
ncbi:hypothetical protein ACLOJK_041486 [Asimina triloba]